MHERKNSVFLCLCIMFVDINEEKEVGIRKEGSEGEKKKGRRRSRKKT